GTQIEIFNYIKTRILWRCPVPFTVSASQTVGSMLLLGSDDGSIIGYSLPQGVPVFQISAHYREITSIVPLSQVSSDCIAIYTLLVHIVSDI
ncbi:hypothetical protein KIPB_015500, partial [Kipferlia bialata]